MHKFKIVVECLSSWLIKPAIIMLVKKIRGFERHLIIRSDERGDAKNKVSGKEIILVLLFISFEQVWLEIRASLTYSRTRMY